MGPDAQSERGVMQVLSVLATLALFALLCFCAGTCTGGYLGRDTYRCTLICDGARSIEARMGGAMHCFCVRPAPAAEPSP